MADNEATTTTPAETTETQAADDPFDFEETPEESLTVADVVAEKAGEQGGKADKDAGEFDQSLVDRALEAGFTEEAARATGSPENLTNLLDTFDRAVAVRGQEALNERTTAESGDAKSETASREKFEIKLDADEYGEGVVEEIKRLNEFYDKQMDDVSGAVLQILDWVKDQDETSARHDFDGFVEGLGKDFEDVLGKGATDKLPKASEARATRGKIRELSEAIRVGYEHIGRTPPEPTELFQRALRGVLGDKMKSLTRSEISQQLNTRSSRHISRPTARKGKGQSPRQSAIRTVAGMMAEMGMGQEDEGAELL